MTPFRRIDGSVWYHPEWDVLGVYEAEDQLRVKGFLLLRVGFNGPASLGPFHILCTRDPLVYVGRLK